MDVLPERVLRLPCIACACPETTRSHPMDSLQARPCLRLALLAGVLSAAPLAGAPVPVEDRPGRQLALLVGVKDYDKAERFPAQAYTEKDVLDLAALLEKAGYQVVVLCDARGARNRDLAPTRANILAPLDELTSKCTRDDHVLVALAGHGMVAGKDKERDSYFCPRDARADDPATLLSIPDLERRLGDSGAGVRLLLVDACRDEAARGRGLDSDGVKLRTRGSAVLFASSTGQV